MFAPRRLVSSNFVFPYFMEVVLSADAVTLRTYEEIAPQAPLNEAQLRGEEVVEFHGVHRPKRVAVRLTQTEPSPVGQHLATRDGERWPILFLGEMDHRVLVPGEALSARLRGKFFVESAVSCLDRKLDPHLFPELWTDAGEWIFAIDSNGRAVAPYNKNIFTQSKRVRGTRFAMMFGHSPVLRLFQPFKDTPLDQCSLYLSVHPTLGCRVTPDLPLTDATGPHADMSLLLPSLRWAKDSATTVSSGQPARLALECVDPVSGEIMRVNQGEIAVEADAGYLPIRRRALINGSAEVMLTALEVPKGHRIRVSAGFDGAPLRLQADLVVV